MSEEMRKKIHKIIDTKWMDFVQREVPLMTTMDKIVDEIMELPEIKFVEEFEKKYCSIKLQEIYCKKRNNHYPIVSSSEISLLRNQFDVIFLALKDVLEEMKNGK